MKSDDYVQSINILSVNPKGEAISEVNSSSDIYNSPIVYILNNNKEIYIGETINILNRFNNHNNNPQKRNLLSRHIIHSDYFNKSVILHLEAFLISHFAAENKLTLINANLGNNSHYYYEKAKYEDAFPMIWEYLLKENIAKTTLREITNSDIFKYSPYKSLTIDQQNAILKILDSLIENNKKGAFVNGCAGTGKTVLAIYLIKLLTTPLETFSDYESEDVFTQEVIKKLTLIHHSMNIKPNDIALVISMSSLRKSLQKVFSKIHGLKKDMVISPTDISKGNYKILLVDEAHRLKQRKNIVNYHSFDKINHLLNLGNEGTELDWILLQSQKQVFFYDENQTIKPSDIECDHFDKLLESNNYYNLSLRTQVRSKGGKPFTDFINDLFDSNLTQSVFFESQNFDFSLFTNIKDMIDKVKIKNQEVGLSLLVAGFAWDWVSKNDKSKKDIIIDGVSLMWNSTMNDFINSPNAINEVGCIHTTQGYDLNYVGVILGPEIDYDFKNKKIIIDKSKYKDQNGKRTASDDDLLDYITNIYKTLMFRGIHGVYIYCCNENIRKYFSQHIKLTSPTK